VPTTNISIDDMFTENERHKASLLAGKEWDELSNLAKFSFGFTARTHLSPEGIANTIIYGEDMSKWPKKERPMKIRYHQHSLYTLIDNSIKEGLDALVDINFELYNYIIDSDVFTFFNRTNDEDENYPQIDGCKFYGWVCGPGQYHNWVRLYNKD
jgi:hypothetical protein